ncbi:MAG: mechanosensitive ion channel family protein [Demequina sp.]|uniref:mechanosensitive ion channel family protein n=1 Tax=Demequina sp. TaxID=2050685 RepID=UPI0019C63A40|nr:mechanosensitive ion channel family protein [Demequina sp.]MBC7297811.1 mechanosensitive ion channel family protein [Demequina sp.]
MLDNWLEFGIAIGFGVGAAVLVALVVHLALRIASRRLAWPQVLVTEARRPFWTLLILLGVWAGANTSLDAYDWWPTVAQAFTIVAIATLAWLLLGLVEFVTDLALGYNPLDGPDNILARRLRTQTLIIRRLAAVLIVVLAFGAALFTFDAVRALGASILASAGIISLVAGFAAQSALANMFAGIQLVFSNALRMDDVIVAEGEWGRVEEITLSYVVLQLWDDRRLVLPSTYFTSTPYQNWTRDGSELLGAVELDLDWRVSLQRMREHLKEVLAETSLYDGRTSVLQVTDATKGHVHVRILATAKDAPTLWDLRCYLREAMVLWVQNEMPDAAPAQRILMADPSAAAERPKPRGKRTPPPEHASDEGLFTGSIQAVERASLFMHGGGPRDVSGDDDGVADTLDLDSPIRD